jgi:hypothetical protein
MTCDLSKEAIEAVIPSDMKLVDYHVGSERCEFAIELFINSIKFELSVTMYEHYNDIHVSIYNQTEGSIHSINAVRLHNPGSNENIVKFLSCLKGYVQEAYNSYRMYVNNISAVLDVEGLAGEYQYVRA